MPFLTNSIGAYNMLAWKGKPVRKQQRVEQITRDGISGDQYRLLGEHGPEFTLISEVDAPSHAQALVGYDAYCDYVGTVRALTINSVDYGNYVVMGVDIVSAPAVTNFVGGLNAPSEVLLTCRWRLCHFSG